MATLVATRWVHDLTDGASHMRTLLGCLEGGAGSRGGSRPARGAELARDAACRVGDGRG
jgi:hypothetical protein